MNSIQWLSQGSAEVPAIDLELTQRWLGQVAAAHDRFVGPLTYIFCDDPRILEVNREFLGHDYYTDIITFDYSRGRMISGDIFLSLDTVATNAEQFGATFDRELHRVLAHGVLHLCGINDKGPGEREVMEQHENQALELFDKLISNPL